MVRIGGIHAHREVLYRTMRDGRAIAPNRHVPIRALLKPDAFALRLRDDLTLPMPTPFGMRQSTDMTHAVAA